jgi:shikimate kinase
MNLILCGMPCSGKSHYGKMLAKNLGRNFIDTDELIISTYLSRYKIQATCREIALKEGDPFFRLMEEESIKGLHRIKNAIIATGGGTLGNFENINSLKSLGYLIYLKTPRSVLLERIKLKNSLPSMFDKDRLEESFDNLLLKRLPIYETHCHYMIDTANEKVLEKLQNYACKGQYHGE